MTETHRVVNRLTKAGLATLLLVSGTEPQIIPLKPHQCLPISIKEKVCLYDTGREHAIFQRNGPEIKPADSFFSVDDGKTLKTEHGSFTVRVDGLRQVKLVSQE